MPLSLCAPECTHPCARRPWLRRRIGRRRVGKQLGRRRRSRAAEAEQTCPVVVLAKITPAWGLPKHAVCVLFYMLMPHASKGMTGWQCCGTYDTAGRTVCGANHHGGAGLRHLGYGHTLSPCRRAACPPPPPRPHPPTHPPTTQHPPCPPLDVRVRESRVWRGTRSRAWGRVEMAGAPRPGMAVNIPLNCAAAQATGRPAARCARLSPRVSAARASQLTAHPRRGTP